MKGIEIYKDCADFCEKFTEKKKKIIKIKLF